MTAESPDIRVGDIVISPREHRLVAGGREVPVTSREFEVFAKLASHPGWVYSPEQLSSSDPRSNSSPEAVNVHISHLRRKLAALGYSDVIATVRGAGYVLRAAGPAPSSSGEWPPFVGRAKELEALEAALADARAGRGRFVLLTGEAGVGKTALAEHAIASAALGSAVVVRVQCDSDGSPEYWMWREIVSAVRPATTLAQDWQPTLALLDEGHSGDVGDLSAADRMRGYDAVLDVLRASCGGPAPVIVLIGDVQWAHASSVRLLRHLSRHLDGMHLAVIVTCQDEALGTRSHLSDLVADACDCSSGTLVPVRGLDLEAVSRIVSSALGDTVGDLAQRVHLLTGGNPLFVREIVHALSEANVEGTGAGNDLSHLPPSIEALVQARIASFPERTRRVLAAAAAVGVSFDAAVVGPVVGLEGDVVADLAPALSARFVVESATPARYRFRHPLLRQALYEGIPPDERQRLHGRVYEIILHSPRGRTRRIFELAHHSSLAGPDYSKSAMGCLAAAERESFRRCAFEGASKYSEQALRMLDATSFSRETATHLRAALLERLGQSRSTEGYFRAALVAYESALWERRHDEHIARARLYARIARAQLELGEFAESRSSLDLADECLERCSVRSGAWWSCWIRSRLQRAELEFAKGDDAGIAASPDLEEAVKAHGSPEQRVTCLERRAEELLKRERFAPGEECLSYAQQAAAVAASRPAEYAHARAVELLGSVLTLRRDLGDAEEVLRNALSLMVRCQDPIGEAAVLSYLALAARFANDVDTVEVRSRQLLDRAADFPTKALAGAARGCLAWVELRRGAPVAASELASHGLADLALSPSFPFAWTAAWPSATLALRADRLDEVAERAGLMLGPRQAEQPEHVERALIEGIAALGRGDAVAARSRFSEAQAQAALLGYA